MACKKAWGEGILSAGMGAKAVCCHGQRLTDCVPGTLGAVDCLGFTPSAHCPQAAAYELTLVYGIGKEMELGAINSL